MRESGALYAVLLTSSLAWAQVAPSAAEQSRYSGLLAAAARGDAAQIAQLAAAGASIDARDGYGRTPLHVAIYAGKLARNASCYASAVHRSGTILRE